MIIFGRGSNVYLIIWSKGRVLNYWEDIKVSWELQFTDYCNNYYADALLFSCSISNPISETYPDFSSAAWQVDTNMIPAYLSLGLAEKT